MDAGVKHLSVHIYLVTSVYQVLQSKLLVCWHCHCLDRQWILVFTIAGSEVYFVDVDF